MFCTHSSICPPHASDTCLHFWGVTDNHVWSAGSITKAVKQARSVAGFSMKIEVEARTLEEACEAVRALSRYMARPLPLLRPCHIALLL